MPKRRQIKYRRDPDVVSMQTKGLHPRTYARMALTQALHSLDVAIGLSYEVLHEPKPEVLELEKAVKAVRKKYGYHRPRIEFDRTEFKRPVWVKRKPD